MLFTCLENKTNNLQLLSKRVYTKIFLVGHVSGKTSLLNQVPYMPTCQRGRRANVLPCQHGLCVNVPACQLAKSVPTSHFYVPTCHTACQCFNLDLKCQCAKWHANFSTWMPTYQNACQFFKHSSYEMLSDYLYFIIIQKILHFT